MRLNVAQLRGGFACEFEHIKDAVVTSNRGRNRGSSPSPSAAGYPTDASASIYARTYEGGWRHAAVVRHAAADKRTNARAGTRRRTGQLRRRGA